LYRRDRANMPGSLREVANAEEEGVEFVWLTQPEAFLGGDNNRVSAVRCSEMHLGVADSTGRQTPRKIDGSERDLPADMVIMALGFDPENLPVLFGEPDLAVSRWGTVLVDPRTAMSNLDGVFAAGDIVRGASLVVWAIRDGRDAADSIHRYIQQGAEAPRALAS
ncbi:MAG: FAD-dependent oxidoreductase, partial [Pseudomonadota bacterium]|nr:FAD-dependent oxidoreductase [Pseudomonadota bacterium]